MKKVKQIQYRLVLTGKGIVNYAGEQGRVYRNNVGNNDPLSHMVRNYDNVQYANRNFYRNADGTLRDVIKISSSCIKKSMFRNDSVAMSPNIMHNEHLLYQYIGSPLYLIRGDLFATQGFKKSSALNITDAEQIDNTAMSVLNFRTRSGKKEDTQSKNTGKSDTSIFNQDSVGEISYLSTGVIDLPTLQFISVDQIYDRLAFDPDKFELFAQFLRLRMPTFNSTIKYYKLKNQVHDLGEKGILLSNEDCLFLVKEILNRMARIDIRRSNAEAHTYSLQIKLSSDALEDRLSDQTNGWIDISSQDDIDKLNFEMDQSYTEVDTNFAIASRKSIEDGIKKDLEEATAEKQKVDEIRKKAKEEKKAKELNGVTA